MPQRPAHSRCQGPSGPRCGAAPSSRIPVLPHALPPRPDPTAKQSSGRDGVIALDRRQQPKPVAVLRLQSIHANPSSVPDHCPLSTDYPRSLQTIVQRPASIVHHPSSCVHPALQIILPHRPPSCYCNLIVHNYRPSSTLNPPSLAHTRDTSAFILTHPHSSAHPNLVLLLLLALRRLLGPLRLLALLRVLALLLWVGRRVGGRMRPVSGRVCE